MLFALGVGAGIMIGYILAEIYYRWVIRREVLIAEFFDKQLWQFLSLDEWLSDLKFKRHKNG